MEQAIKLYCTVTAFCDEDGLTKTLFRVCDEENVSIAVFIAKAVKEKLAKY